MCASPTGLIMNQSGMPSTLSDSIPFLIFVTFLTVDMRNSLSVPKLSSAVAQLGLSVSLKLVAVRAHVSRCERITER